MGHTRGPRSRRARANRSRDGAASEMRELLLLYLVFPIAAHAGDRLEKGRRVVGVGAEFPRAPPRAPRPLILRQALETPQASEDGEESFPPGRNPPMWVLCLARTMIWPPELRAQCAIATAPSLLSVRSITMARSLKAECETKSGGRP